MSTAWRVVSASADLEPSVLASRLNSCDQEIKPAPHRYAGAQIAAELCDVGGEPVQLFADIEFLCEQGDLLLQAFAVGRNAQRRDPLGQPFADTRQYGGQAADNRGDTAFDFDQPSLEHLFDACAFTAAGLVKVGQCGVKAGDGQRQQGGKILLFLLQDSGPAQQLERVQSRPDS